jgi:hypothetical protein
VFASVDSLDRNDPLVHTLRAYQQYRMSLNFKCVSDSRLEQLNGYIAKMEHYCEVKIVQIESRIILIFLQKVSQCGPEYKSFSYTKQHDSCHVVDLIRGKGATRNSSTRPGEGVHQEVKQAYQQSNFKNAVAQVRTLFTR